MDAEELNETRQANEAFITSMTSRGGIIDLAVTIEDVLTDIIAWCFYPTKKESNSDIFDTLNQLDENGIILKATLLVKLDFSQKIDILKTVISAKHLLPMAKYKNLMAEITTNLTHIRKFRNKLAHSPLDISPTSLKSLTYQKPGKGTYDFQIIQYKNGKAIKHRIDISGVKTELHIIVKCWYQLIQLFALLKDDTEDARACEILSTMTKEEGDYLLKKLGLKH